MERTPKHAVKTEGTAFKPLFFVAVLLAVALAAACVKLNDQRQDSLDREAALSRQLVQMKIDLEERENALEQAQGAIDLMEEYSLATPDGEVPEYTQLFPELYAPERKGEPDKPAVDEKVVYLTFDDGPSANTDTILQILDQYGIKATFFVVGRTSEQDQQRMRDIVNAGHTLAMHSWSHDYRTIYASVDAFLEDFDRLFQWIEEVTGVQPQIFRFPGGSINGYDRGTYQEIVAEMSRRGFVYFDWNASAQDATVKPLPADTIAANCLKGIGKNRVVVLCHDSSARVTTTEALPAVIEGYQAAGYTFAALTPDVMPVTFGYPAS